MSDPSSERYQRHGLIDWFDQARIKNLEVLVIGAGAVGNEVIKNLVLLGVGAIRVVDFDRIEVHNLTRSVLFTEADIGQPKASVAAAAAQRLDPGCKLEAIHGDFWDRLSFSQIQEADVVFCCVDNFEARFRINRLCSLLGVDLVNAGIDSRAVSAGLYPFGRVPESACLECNYPPDAYRRAAARYSCGWLRKVAFEEKKIPTTAITSSHAGALATSLFLYSQREDAEPGAKEVFMDTISNTTSRIALARAAECAGCGRNSAKRVFLRSRRSLASLSKWLPSSDVDFNVVLSDPVLTQWEAPGCAQCHEAGPTVVFRRAVEFDDSATQCSTCGQRRRQPVIRDTFSVSELLTVYGEQEMPVKFVTFKVEETQVIIELQD